MLIESRSLDRPADLQSVNSQRGIRIINKYINIYYIIFLLLDKNSRLANRNSTTRVGY